MWSLVAASPQFTLRRPSNATPSIVFPNVDAVEAVGPPRTPSSVRRRASTRPHPAAAHPPARYPRAPFPRRVAGRSSKRWARSGKGHFAKVKEVVHIEAQESYAVKILDKSHAENDVEDMVREFQMLRALRHPNIIRLYAAYESPHKLYLVTELASGGELMKRLATTEKTYSEDAVRDHIRAILTAVQYMHEKGCVHRDIKPENVLLSDNTTGAQIKIVDLGLSRFHDERKLMRTICGTHKYLAPELIKCDRGQAQGYDKTIDMWGVGLLAYIMLFGFNPFARSAQTETHNAILAHVGLPRRLHRLEGGDGLCALLVPPRRAGEAALGGERADAPVHAGRDGRLAAGHPHRRSPPREGAARRVQHAAQRRQARQGAHRRLGLDDRKEGSSSSVTH